MELDVAGCAMHTADCGTPCSPGASAAAAARAAAAYHVSAHANPSASAARHRDFSTVNLRSANPIPVLFMVFVLANGSVFRQAPFWYGLQRHPAAALPPAAASAGCLPRLCSWHGGERAPPNLQSAGRSSAFANRPTPPVTTCRLLNAPCACCRLANSLYSRHTPLLAALMFPAVAAFPLWDAGRLCSLLQAAPGIQAPIRRLYRWTATAQ